MNFQVTAFNFRSEIKRLALKFFDNRYFSYLLILAVVTVLYHPYLGHNFISEDFVFIEKVRSNFSLYHTFIVNFFNKQSLFYRPITRDVFYKISYSLFGLNAIGYRIPIFLLFIINNYLVYEIANILTKRKNLAVVASIFFATRGVHSTALCWISAAFQENGMVFFALCTIFLYLRYLEDGKRFFYVSSLICSILALLSKETSFILPALIFLIEIYARKSIKHFNLKVLIGRIIPFCMATLIFMLRNYRALYLHSESHYKMKVSFGIMSKNLLYYIAHFFNTRPELYILGILIFLSFLKVEYRKYSLFSIAWLFIGLFPFVFIAEHAGLYCLSLSLVGFSFLLSIGIKSLHNKFFSEGYIVIPLLFFLIFSVHANSDTRNQVNQLYSQEKLANNILGYLKNSFPYFPKGSLIYIKNSDDFLNWVLGSGAAIRVNYDNNISVYFEGVTKKLPSHSGKVYYFYYDNENIHFLNESTELVIVKP